MSDHDPKKTLSEISHLFLSSIRDKQTNGAPRPQRTPPQPSAPAPAPIPAPAPQGQGLPKREPGGPWSGMNIDLTPAELAQVGPEVQAGQGDAAAAAPRKHPPVCAVIASHLNGKQFDRVKDYARHLAGQVGGRIGLIELDASEFRLMCFEPGMPAEDGGGANGQSAEVYDPRQIAEAVEELNWDVDRWLLLLPTPRVPEARALLRQVDHWVLLTTCDHDGVVAGYRSLKGLIETSHAPKVTLALLDGAGDDENLAVFRKLSAVCQQFLNLRLDAEAPVRQSYRIGEHLVMLCRPTRDKAQMANPPQWAVVSQFLDRNRGNGATPKGEETVEQVTEENESAEPRLDAIGMAPGAAWNFGAELVVPAAPATESAEPTVFVSAAMEPAPPATAVAPSAPTPVAVPTGPAAFDEVIDLPDDSGTAEAVLSAVLRQNNGSYVECPVRAPMCGGVRVAVGRDRGVVLFAVAREGLGELRSIGQALRWLSDNRTLLGMALPQFAIDTHQAPRLRLLVDHSDLSADALQPVLQSGSVTVQSYRKLRWGNKTGLLLDAA